MPFRFKIDVLSALKDAGYSTYRLRREKVFSEATLQRIREGRLPSQSSLERICEMLRCQPGDILVYDFENQTK